MKSLLKLSLAALLTLHVSGLPNPEPKHKNALDCDDDKPRQVEHIDIYQMPQIFQPEPINYPQEQVHYPQEPIHYPQEPAHYQKEEPINYPQEPINYPQVPLIYPQEPIQPSTQIVYVPVEISTPKPAPTQNDHFIFPLLENAKSDNEAPVFDEAPVRPQSVPAQSPAAYSPPRHNRPQLACFACSTSGNSHCWHPTNSTTTTKYCPPNQQMCVVRTYGQKGSTILVRDCGSGCNCGPEEPLQHDRCRACVGNLCNTHTKDQVLNGAPAVPSLVVAPLVALLVTLIKHFG